MNLVATPCHASMRLDTLGVHKYTYYGTALQPQAHGKVEAMLLLRFQQGPGPEGSADVVAQKHVGGKRGKSQQSYRYAAAR